MEVNTSNLDTNFEKWASIDGYLNYQVSWWGRVLNTTTGRILKGSMTNGYLRVGLCKNGKQKLLSIHQLVAREWVPNPENKRCVDHIDNDKVNNHHENLRYATHSENGLNATKTNKARSSIYKGVYLHKQSNKRMAYIQINRKLKGLGLFEDEREAAEVCNAAALVHYKEYARLNKFDD